jgi:uncharacterized repeat protein (TIGR03803 family)
MQTGKIIRNCIVGIATWALCYGAAWAQSIVVTPLHTLSTNTSAANANSLIAGKVDGSLYGTTYDGNTNGTIFTINPDGSGYAILHTFTAAERFGSFSPGSGTPQQQFVMQGNDGKLYGTTTKGGATGNGTIFRLNANGTGYTVIHDSGNSDAGPTSLIQGNDGVFYGGAGTVVFKIDGSGSNYTVLHSFNANTDGVDLLGPLVQANNGLLYGTALSGGTNFNGTIFSLTTNGTAFNVLHLFTGGDDGGHPMAGLIQGSDGALYGSTTDFGTNGPVEFGAGGTLFKIDIDGNNYQVLHRFSVFTLSPNDGSSPFSALVEGSGGILYGTTFGGGNGRGTIFKIGLGGNGYASLYYFTNSSLGKLPVAGLVKGQTQADISVFYGVNSSGPPGSGVIFAALVNPPLFITPVVSQTVSNQTAVFWPAWAVKYTLQATTNIASSNWVNVTDSVPVYGAQVTSTNPAMYYRLVSP